MKRTPVCVITRRLANGLKFNRINTFHYSTSNNTVSIDRKAILEEEKNKTEIHCQHSALQSSFFRRQLPENLVSFSSVEGRQLFKQALQGNYMNCYFSIADQYSTQQEPAFCGLTSLIMCLNALGIDPKRIWKGPWRYFTEELLDCCVPISVVQQRGISFNNFECLAKCNGAYVESYMASKSSEEEFRSKILQATQLDNEEHIVVSYSRSALGQTGSGHFSPIGGYHAEKDLVLVLDTARFKYNAHWVPVPLLFSAMSELNSDGCSRGYFSIRRDAKLLTLNSEQTCLGNSLNKPLTVSTWSEIGLHLFRSIPTYIKNESPTSVKHLMLIVINNFPFINLEKYFKQLFPEIHATLNLVRSTKLFTIISNHFAEFHPVVPEVVRENKNYVDHLPEFITLLLLACPSKLFSSCCDELRVDMLTLRDFYELPDPLPSVAMKIREEMFFATKTCIKCNTEL